MYSFNASSRTAGWPSDQTILRNRQAAGTSNSQSNSGQWRTAAGWG
eukprot:COSAG01_NODE_26521_length_711_cov_1.419935_2_plen_45_part_01